MSQTSLAIYQHRGGLTVQEQGKLPVVSEYNALRYLTTTMLVHYYYEDAVDHHVLKTVTLAAVPNGRLQQKYNASETDTIWLVGRNAPTLGEDFRVRLSFLRLKAKASWRVQRLDYDVTTRRLVTTWDD
jgi:hypothetical protein